jgi:hypothetical protein
MAYTTNAEIAAEYDYSHLPERMQESLRAYIEHGVLPARADFLYELLTNDLYGVFKFGDAENLGVLPGWLSWLYNNPPSGCWGSREKVAAWVAKGGMLGFVPCDDCGRTDGTHDLNMEH